MPFNGTGTYTRIWNWVSEKGLGNQITASKVDQEAYDIGTGLSLCICRDGQSTTTAAIPFAAGIKVNDGTAAAPAIYFAADADTGIYRSDTNALTVASGGAI